MAVNVVEILVRAKDMTKEGFASADAQSMALGSRIKMVGAMAAGGLALVGFEASKMAIDFDAQMTRLNTQAGVSKGAIAGLKSGVLALASQVGFSPDSLAESLYHVASNMASMGASSSKMLSIVKVAAEGARVGGADLVDVTNALTAAVASGIPGVKNMSQAMGMLNATVGAGDMKMQDLAEAFGSGMVATVKGFGLSLKDVGAALATFGDNNIRGAHAGTMLRMAVMALAAPAAAGRKALEGMGLSMTSLATDMRQGGLLKALEDLHSHFVKAGITAKEQGAIITQIFGKKAGAGINVLMDQLDRLKSKYPAITRAAGDFGKAWGTTQGTLKQKLDDLKGGFDALMITIGQKLVPVIQAVVGWMLKHKQIVVDLLIAVGVLAGGLAVLSGILTAISILSDPFALIIIGVAALVAGVIYAYKHFKTFRDVVHDVAHFFVTLWQDAMHVAGAVVQWFVNGPLKWIREQLAVVTDFWKSHSKEIQQVTHAVWVAISTYVKISLMIIKAAITPFLETIKIIWRVAWTVIKDTVKTVWKLIGQDIHMAIQLITGIIGIALDLITGHWGKAWSDIKKTAKNMLHDTIGIIKTAVSGFGHLLWDAGRDLLKGLIGGMKSMVGAMIGAAENIGKTILGGIKSFLGIGSPSRITFMHGQMLAQGLIDGMDSMRGQLGAAAGRMAGGALPGGYGGGGGRGQLVIEIHPPAGAAVLGHEFWTAFMNGIRVRGGSPDLVLRKVVFA